MTNSPTPEGAQEATDGRESASTGESEAQGVQPATGAAESRTAAPGPASRRALAVDAVGRALNEHGAWLAPVVRQAVADAVLAATEPAPAETQAADGVGGGCALPGFMACNCDHVDGCQHPAAPAPAELRCVCGAPIEWMDVDVANGSGWIHAPGSDTPCLDAVLAVRDTELQQLRDEVAKLRLRQANRAEATNQYVAIAEDLIARIRDWARDHTLDCGGRCHAPELLAALQKPHQPARDR